MNKNKVALLIGASGAVGKQLLTLLLANDNYHRVIVLVRKPTGIEHNKLDEKIVDFELVLRNKADYIVGQIDHFYCCLGTTIKVAGSKQGFIEIDKELTTTIAKQAYEHGASYCALISAMGANCHSRIFYNQVKGETELCFREIGFKSLAIFRPSLLKAKREHFRLGEGIANVLMPLFNIVLPNNYRAIHVRNVALAMLKAGLTENKGEHVILSGAMQ